MSNYFDRTEKLIGKEALGKLVGSNVCVFGLGGVGSAVVEGLVRGGIGNITIVDGDTIDETNINRQLIALSSNIGQKKTEVCRKRILEINPNCNVKAVDLFFLPENSSELDLSLYDYIVDAVDTVSAKIEIIMQAKRNNVPVISSMGTGNKLKATGFKVADIFETSVCPLARIMRHELKERNITDVKVVYSQESSLNIGGRTPSSISYVPPVAGYIIAGEVLKDIFTNREDSV